MNQIIHDIFVNRARGVARVLTRNLSTGGPVLDGFVLNPGDQVTFTSNESDTAIRYLTAPPSHPGKPAVHQKGSPLKELAPDVVHKLNGTLFTVKTRCTFDDAFHFECGHIDGTGTFLLWGAVTGHPQGGDSPGPND